MEYMYICQMDDKSKLFLNRNDNRFYTLYQNYPKNNVYVKAMFLGIILTALVEGISSIYKNIPVLYVMLGTIFGILFDFCIKKNQKKAMVLTDFQIEKHEIDKGKSDLENQLGILLIIILLIALLYWLVLDKPYLTYRDTCGLCCGGFLLGYIGSSMDAINRWKFYRKYE